MIQPGIVRASSIGVQMISSTYRELAYRNLHDVSALPLIHEWMEGSEAIVLRTVCDQCC